MAISVGSTLRILSRLKVCLNNSSRRHHFLNTSLRSTSELINSIQGRNNGVQSVYNVNNMLLPVSSSVNGTCVRCFSRSRLRAKAVAIQLNPFRLIRRIYNRIQFVNAISRYEEFSHKGLESGVKQALLLVTQLIKDRHYEELEELLAPKAFEKLKVFISDMSGEDHDILQRLDCQECDMLLYGLDYFVHQHEGDEAEAVVEIKVNGMTPISVPFGFGHINFMNWSFSKLISPVENNHSWMISDIEKIHIRHLKI